MVPLGNIGSGVFVGLGTAVSVSVGFSDGTGVPVGEGTAVTAPQPEARTVTVARQNVKMKRLNLVMVSSRVSTSELAKKFHRKTMDGLHGQPSIVYHLLHLLNNLRHQIKTRGDKSPAQHMEVLRTDD